MALNENEAAALKTLLLGKAGELNIDLKDPANRYTLWSENGTQGYLCWGKAPYPYEVYRQLGHLMFTQAVILEVTASGCRVTRITSEVG